MRSQVNGILGAQPFPSDAAVNDITPHLPSPTSNHLSQITAATVTSESMENISNIEENVHEVFQEDVNVSNNAQRRSKTNKYDYLKNELDVQIECFEQIIAGINSLKHLQKVNNT